MQELFIAEQRKPKIFRYDQNNSGGSFVKNSDLDVVVYIQAFDENQANEIADEIGIYFNGCEAGIDCDCYGDRWHSPHDSFENKENFLKSLKSDITYMYFSDKVGILHTLNGERHTIYKNRVVTEMRHSKHDPNTASFPLLLS